MPKCIARVSIVFGFMSENIKSFFLSLSLSLSLFSVAATRTNGLDNEKWPYKYVFINVTLTLAGHTRCKFIYLHTRIDHRLGDELLIGLRNWSNLRGPRNYDAVRAAPT